MISRRTSRLLAELYEYRFCEFHSSRGSRNGYFTINIDVLYDFLYDNDYPTWFCNAVKSTFTTVDTRKFKEFMMRIHTGESLLSVTKDWDWNKREKLGQQFLFNLAEDILNITKIKQQLELTMKNELIRSLEIDGYLYKDSRLLIPETDVLDVEEETRYIHSLYIELGLEEKDTAFHHLNLSEEHYINHKWDDSISNSRKFLESTLQNIANKNNIVIYGNSLTDDIYKWPVKVRTYLETEGLLESKEKDALSSIYGLLSETGGHPYMAQNEQARLLRHLALTLAQFVMLRLKGKLDSLK